MENKPKLTIEDLICETNNNNNQKKYTYKIANNQKEYSHKQKVKP